MVAFYNVGDQAIYQGGQHFIPQEQYRLGYVPPGVVGANAEQGITTSGTGVGIPYTGAFTNSGGGGGGINEDDTRSYIPLSQRNKNIGFLTNLSNQAKDSWSGIKDSTIGRGFQQALSPLMHLINLRNPFHPDAQNYNPLLLNQQDLALRSADLEGFGWTQDRAGRFVGSADPDDPNYNPLYGQNLVSGFGTNDLTQMLQKRLNYLQNKDYESDIKDEKIRIIKEKLATSQQGDKDTIESTPALQTSHKTTVSDAQKQHGGGGAPGGIGGTQHGSSGMTKDQQYAFSHADGGRAGFFQGALADTAEGQAMSPGTSATGEFRGGEGGQGDGNNYNISQTNPIKQIALNQIMKKGAAQGGILGSVMGHIPQLMALQGLYNKFNRQRNHPNITEEDVIYGQNLRHGGLARLL